VDGRESERVLLHAFLNASYETGFMNPIDEAIRKYRQFDLSNFTKLDEIPYDFIRKRLSILASEGEAHLMVTKGALSNVLAVCSSAELAEGRIVDIGTVEEQLQRQFEEFSRKGFRTLGVAYKNVVSATVITREQETDMTFLGFLILFDPPKPGIIETIRQLKQLGRFFENHHGDNRCLPPMSANQVELLNRTSSPARSSPDE